MKKNLPWVLVMCLGGTLLSQPLRWLPGTVVLHTQEVLKGEVCFQTADLFLFRQEGSVQAVSPRQAASFRYFDAEDSLLHHLVARADGQGVVRFFEVVLPGKVEVMRLFMPRVPVSRPVSHRDDFTYFVCYANELVELRLFRKKILPQLNRHQPQLVAHIRKRNLRPQLPADAIRIVQLFNQQTVNPVVVALRQ